MPKIKIRPLDDRVVVEPVEAEAKTADSELKDLDRPVGVPASYAATAAWLGREASRIHDHCTSFLHVLERTREYRDHF